MRTPLIGLMLALFLCDCARIEDYASTEVTTFVPDGDDLYRVVDQPTTNKLTITASVSLVAAQTARTSKADPASTKPVFERVGVSYLTRRGCRLLDGHPLVGMRWEFNYDCSGPEAQTQRPSA